MTETQLGEPAFGAAGTVSRRTVLKAGIGGGLGAALPLDVLAGNKTLDGSVLDTWAAWLDTLVPGAAKAGARDYLRAQLLLPPSERVLFLRYTDWPGSHAHFYRDALAAVDQLSLDRHGRAFVRLKAAEQLGVASEVAGGQAPGWQGPPAGLFHFVSKADGADLVFGTERGIERLGLAYRAHIAPTLPWPVVG